MIKTKEDIIIEHIKEVTNGIQKHMKETTLYYYSKWNNAATKLTTIKNYKHNFYLGVRMWLNITQNKILNIKNNVNENLESLKNKYLWVNNIIEIKKILNIY